MTGDWRTGGLGDYISLVRVLRNDPWLEHEHVGIVRLDARADPMCVASAECLEDGVVQTADASVRIDFGNTGQAAAVFQVRSANTAHGPRTYTVEPGRTLSGPWSVAGIGATQYDIDVYGPNGFLRAFRGSVLASAQRLGVRAACDAQTNHLTLTIANLGAREVTVDVLDRYSGKVRSRNIDAGASASIQYELTPFDG